MLKCSWLSVDISQCFVRFAQQTFLLKCARESNPNIDKMCAQQAIYESSSFKIPEQLGINTAKEL
jgi:hypothetical protein